MTKVLIMSDSHGLTNEITMIKERHEADYLIHCGDSELNADANELINFYTVTGNCDLDPHYEKEQIIKINDLTFYVTHGHLLGVKTDLTRLSMRAEEVGADVICFGHTHLAGSLLEDHQLFINPGSIRMPRRREEKTYVVMEWDKPDDIKIRFYALDGSEVSDLAYQVSLPF
ncbi:YfcE family phosphodiesterase [Oceanobacillus sp. 143]|uniref:Phosphoesterase n=1 Tax=Oceanobacillus zhaokaii TaxID=2052660 RepID=A0A345PHY2_9BACI|nr:metallophosphoesterase [Oceanobacillus zhaokaii]AXI09612.1 YfcE family phosphodiesterase [Oceanobacillus zhaokaii]QGS68970.1 YfcE family phosphodiesterase [Oceanobacillus sp. 143]